MRAAEAAGLQVIQRDARHPALRGRRAGAWPHRPVRPRQCVIEAALTRLRDGDAAGALDLLEAAPEMAHRPGRARHGASCRRQTGGRAGGIAASRAASATRLRPRC